MARRKAPKGCYWRGNTLWAQAEVGGRRTQWSLHTSDWEEAKKLRAAEVGNLKAQIFHGTGTHAPLAIIPLWEKEWPKLNERLRPLTIARYKCSFDQIDQLETLKDMRQLDRDVLTEIIEARQNEDDVTVRTLLNDMSALSSLCEFSMHKGWMTDNPTLMARRVLKARPSEIILPRERDIETMRKLAAPGLVRMMDGAIATGCRQDELRCSSRDDIDHKRKQFTVVGKGGKRRTIDLTPFDGYRVLTAMPATLGTDALFASAEGVAYSKDFKSRWVAAQWAIFKRFYDKKHGTDDNTRPSRAELSDAEFSKGWIDIGFRRFRYHDLRHLHAVRFLKGGLGGIYELCGRLGHTSVQTTEMYLRGGYLTEAEKVAARGLAGMAAPAAAVSRG